MKFQTEVDFVVIKLSNLARVKGVLVSEEFDKITKHLNKKDKSKVISNLQKLGFECNDKMIISGNNVHAPHPIKEKNLLSYLIRPEYVNTSRSHIQMGAQFYQCIRASGFPAQVKQNWLGKLTQEKGNVDFSVHIQPSSIRGLELYLNSQLKQVENDLYKYRMKGLHNPSLENRKKELLEQLNSLIRGDYKLYKMSLYLASKASSVEDAETISQRILASLHSDGIEGEKAINYQEQMIKSLIPTGRDFLTDSQILVPGPAAAASFPFSSSFYEVDEEDGVLLGFNDNGIPIGKSIWKLPKYIGAVLGATGSGKSYAAKALLLNDQLIHGTKVFVLDPEGEYVKMAKNIPDAQVISLSRNSSSIPNILDLMGNELIDKLSSLSRVFEVLLEGISDIQKPLLEQALIETYKRKGITDNKKTWKKAPPVLSDLIRVLQLNKKRCSENASREYEILISKLSRYTKGIFKFLNRNGKINLKSDFIVFEFSEMTEEIRPIMMLILLEFIKTKFNQDKEKKMLVLDEAWRMLKSREEANYVEGFARTFRKRNGGMLLITQSVAELKDSPEGKAVLANTSFRYLLRTENVLLEETCELFGLNKSEKDILANARPGQGVLVWEDKHYKVNVHVDPSTHEIITTNPNEK